MLDIKQQLLKNKKYCVNIKVKSNNSNILDTIAKHLNKGVRLFQLDCNELTSKDSLQIALSIRQLCAHFDCLLIIKDRADIAKITDADGIFLDCNSIGPNYIKEFIDSNKIIGSDGTYKDSSDYIISNDYFGSKITYKNDGTSPYILIKEVI